MLACFSLGKSIQAAMDRAWETYLALPGHDPIEIPPQDPSPLSPGEKELIGLGIDFIDEHTPGGNPMTHLKQVTYWLRKLEGEGATDVGAYLAAHHDISPSKFKKMTMGEVAEILRSDFNRGNDRRTLISVNGPFGLVLHPNARRATRGAEEVAFESKNMLWRMFEHLCNEYPQHIPTLDLGRIPDQDVFPNTVQAHVSQLRRLVRKLGLGVKHFRGSGYCLINTI